MKISDLKKGFWGYRKESVYQYIAALNEEFSQKLLEKDEKNEALIRELRDKNIVLEGEISAMRKESGEYRKLQFAVSDSIIDAQNYAAQLKSETQRKEQALRSKIDKQMAQKRLQLEGYISEIEEFRTQLKSMLENMDASLQQSQNQAAQMMKQACVEGGEDKDDGFGEAAESGAPEETIEPEYSTELLTSNMSMFQRRGKK